MVRVGRNTPPTGKAATRHYNRIERTRPPSMRRAQPGAERGERYLGRGRRHTDRAIRIADRHAEGGAAAFVSGFVAIDQFTALEVVFRVAGLVPLKKTPAPVCGRKTGSAMREEEGDTSWPTGWVCAGTVYDALVGFMPEPPGLAQDRLSLCIGCAGASRPALQERVSTAPLITRTRSPTATEGTLACETVRKEPSSMRTVTW